MTVDNAFTLYLSTDDAVAGTEILTGSDWGAIYTTSTGLAPGVKHYLHLVAADYGAPAAFLGEFTLSDTAFAFVNTTQTLLTKPAEWGLSSTGFGGGYSTPTSSGNNGVGPWGFHSGISSSAEWLDFPGGSISYFSAEIVPVPEPAHAAVSAAGLIGLGLYWRQRKAAARG